MASIGALLFINQKGEVVISRMYRDGFSRSVADTFRTQILGNKDDMRSPVKVIGDTCFMYIKHGNMYVVAVTSGNAQAAMTFQFLHSCTTVLKAYFGAFDEDSIRNNFVLIYELLDEMLDYGYPQNVTTDVLKMCARRTRLNHPSPLLSPSRPVGPSPLPARARALVEGGGSAPHPLVGAC